MSGSETWTWLNGTFPSAAAIWAREVFAPWPISTVLVNTFRLPSGLSFTVTVDVVGVAMPFMIALNPFARILFPSLTTKGPLRQPIFSAAPFKSSV